MIADKTSRQYSRTINLRQFCSRRIRYSSASDISKLYVVIDTEPEKGFEIIPVEPITGIITEDGLFDPGTFIAYMESGMSK